MVQTGGSVHAVRNKLPVDGVVVVVLVVLQVALPVYICPASGQVDGVSGSIINTSTSSSTLHAVGAELLPGQVDGVVVLLSVTLLPLLEIRPAANILQTLLGVPHRDHLLGLMEGK